MGQCCRKDSTSGDDGVNMTGLDGQITKPKIKGLLYEEFAELVMMQYSSGDVQTPNTAYEDPRRAWLYTAKLLDEGQKGYLVWEDIESKIVGLAREWDQATFVSDIIETLTRSRVKLKHVFAALDTDGGGRLCQSEFFEGLSLLLGTKDHVEVCDAKLLWNMLDQDKDGAISWEEFMTGLSVEDTWDVSGARTATPPMATHESGGEKKKQRRSVHEIFTEHVPIAKIAEDLGQTVEDTAARRIIKFFRKSRAHRALLARVWQLTLHALDLADEKEINTDEDTSEDASDDGSADTDTGYDPQDDPIAPPVENSKSGLVLNLPEIIQQIRKRELPPREIASAIICRVSRLHREEPNVGLVDVPADGQLIIVGDIHGQLDDLLLILDEGGLPSQTAYLFNGDFVDRGMNGVEVLLLIYALKLSWPDKIFLNRGNHEAKRLNEKYGFDEEVAYKYDMDLFRTITKSFCMLPLAHVVAGQFFVVHGGLSVEEKVTLQEFNAIDRFKQIPKKADSKQGEKWRLTRIFEGAVWSDPRDIPVWEESKRGAGVHFGKSTVEDFLKTNGLKKLIRSHESFQPGYAEHHDRLTITIFSASNYCGTDENMGCYLVLRPNLELQYRQYRIAGDAERLRNHVKKALSKGQQVETDAEQDAMNRIRMLIFCKRSELLHAFQEADEEKSGKVYVDHWSRAMQRVINEQVPWRIIRRSLTPMERDGMIAYVQFLQRYQNRMQQSWSVGWSAKMLVLLGDRMRLFVEETSAQKGKVLSYYEMCDNLRRFIPGLGETASYHIVLAMDTNKDGYIDVDEFIGAFNISSFEAAASVPSSRSEVGTPATPLVNDRSCIIELWEMYSFDQISYAILKRSFLRMCSQRKLERAFDNPPRSKDGWKSIVPK